MDEKIIQLLKNPDKSFTINGNNVRLFWQFLLEGVTITRDNRKIVCEGWNVVTWKKGKPISIYFGDSFENALDVLENFDEGIK